MHSFVRRLNVRNATQIIAVARDSLIEGVVDFLASAHNHLQFRGLHA